MLVQEVEKWLVEKAALGQEDAQAYARQLSARGIASVADLLGKPLAEWGIKVSGYHDPKIQRAWCEAKAEAVP